MARILLVDDERDVVTLIKFMLEKDGHTVIAAYNGVEALARLGIDPRDETAICPDLVILDVMMPLMDGYAVCSQLQEDARTRTVPVIVLTAKGETKDLFNATPNVAAHIEKPFDPKALRELVAGMLAPEKR
ncbi:MAG: response regulator [Elusimicrobia bacterium]|nr:response regulator [Elusimicrobiota bacterium]